MPRHIALTLLVCLSACQATDALVVGAAASLSGVLPELVAGFRAVHPDVPVTTTVGSSGQLARQIRQGAPIDLFLSADAGWVDTLVAAGRVSPRSRSVYARGQLALWSRDPGASFEHLADLATLDGPIAIANPEIAPYGRAAMQALGAAGLAAALDSRIVIGGNVRQALQYSETGNAVAAFIAYPLVVDAGGHVVLVPESLYDPIEHVLGIVDDDTSHHARLFADFVLGPAGRAILARRGFGVDAP